MPSGVLTQHQAGLGCADHFGAHNFVGLLVLEHAVLVDAGFVGEGIGADNGFVGLDGDAGVIADQFTDAGQLGGIDACRQVVEGAAGMQRHDHFFQGGVAGALADAVDGDFLPGAPGMDASQGVGGGQTQVVVAVHRDDAVFDAGCVRHDTGDQSAKFVRRGVADRIGNVQGGGASLDGDCQDFIQEFWIGRDRRLQG